MITVQLPEQAYHNLFVFLDRVQLSGAEVSAFNEIKDYLSNPIDLNKVIKEKLSEEDMGE